MKLLAVLLVLVHSCAALRILLTSTDSWVSKNVRFMYESLKEEGHDVRVVAPLYNRRRGSAQARGRHATSTSTSTSGDHQPEEEYHQAADPQQSGEPQHNRDAYASIGDTDNPVAPQDADITDGGEFGHLLPVHQTYYSNIKHMNQSPRGAKGVLKKEKRRHIVGNKHFGHDPLDENIWYVNTGALDTLVIGMDVIAPQIGFEPELVLVGPNEGAHWTPSGNAGGPRAHRGRGAIYAMLSYCMSKNVPSIAVSTEDSHHVYYHDEKYFNIEPKQGQSFFKGNVFGKNVQFFNRKVADVIAAVKLDGKTALNIIFPSINHAESRCFTSATSTLEFKQVEQDTVPPESVQFPQYEYSDDKLTMVKQYKHATAHNSEPKSRKGGRKGNRFINPAERDVVSSCGISLNVISAELGSGVHRSVLDVESMVQSA